MIATLTGSLVKKGSQTAIIDTGGVGYQLMMPSPDIASLPPVGSQVTVYTYLQVKDDSMNLYGFEAEAKKGLFVQLISVSNVGPKVALNLLSHLTAEQLMQAIITEDNTLISGAPGVGRKTAQRLILELKDTLGTGAIVDAAAMTSPFTQAQQALMGLGYQAFEASQALAGATEGKSVDWYIKFALKRLAKV